MSAGNETGGRWYEGITRYQWLVLLIASLGWIFDVFEGQIFVASMKDAMPALVDPAELVSFPLSFFLHLPESLTSAERLERIVALYNNVALASFLIGGAVGGILFGMLSDRIGRTKVMILTILMYSCFTCVTAFAHEWWHMVILRFLVAMGVGGEWAVASAMVAEVFPKKARAWSLGIFHASSVLGTYMAILAGAFIVGNQQLGDFGWRIGFAIGALPALLTLWIRWSLREPEKWVKAREVAKKDSAQQTGRLLDLFAPGLLRNTLVGVSLATVGLATFWGVHIYGRNLLRQSTEREYLAALPDTATEQDREAVLKEYSQPIKRSEMLGMFLVTTGGGLGLVCFGPICERIGRRGAFLLYHVGSLISSLVLFQLLAESAPQVLWITLPVFGFLTVGMHAGYAIYFPELFPTRLRGTGGGFCFNGGRIFAAPILILIGWMRGGLAMSLEDTVSILSLLFLLGAVVSLLGPETKGRELPT
ncbi:MAG: MFS transporter [Planctomycetota bacterium]